ncbi:ABC transporter ATP-binding protein [Variovorax ginsengisoli]|uniref:Branched-chain amino acid transport system ATP-binding protein n=1 Tax=Variovorax ginsengisoli TaxID=363844 RepID=A0ABT9SDV2_9BURK|nr:ABC transporter ATP-binding protein [Variovorax ginsengisoli]MDP9901921.1 branched-chain amino acid transport system ATP-binding protein [Variovorax ginsengisoli]
MSLEIRNLSAGYGDVVVLRDVSFEVPQDGIVSLLGANGAGKTTTLNAISGLLTEVKAGSILLDGVDIGRLPAHERVEAGLAHVPQGRHLFPFMSVRENLEMGAYSPRGRGMETETLDWLFSIFPKVKERLSQNAGSLSGGEQQMCAIARGLMSQPKYLLLDEPSLGLAPIVVRQVMSVIRTIAERGIGVLLVEQNVAQALKLAKYAYVLEHSGIAIEGSAETLAGDDRVRKAYLGL